MVHIKRVICFIVLHVILQDFLMGVVVNAVFS